MLKNESENSIETIFNLYKKYGNHKYGEGVTQLQHMLQCAHIAQDESADDEMVLAAFLHDIGHLIEAEDNSEKMGKFGKLKHDNFGAKYLEEIGFSKKIVALVGGHVKTKRYMAFKQPKYLKKLSKASKATLTYQGGQMSAEEANEFERDFYFVDHIQLRKWDDTGKIEGLNFSDKELNKMKELALKHLSILA